MSAAIDDTPAASPPRRWWLPRLTTIADICVERGESVTVNQVTDQAVSYGLIIPGIGAAIGTEKYRSQQNNLHKIMRATIDDLDDVEGVGEARARAIKEGLSRLAETSILDRYS